MSLFSYSFARLGPFLHRPANYQCILEAQNISDLAPVLGFGRRRPSFRPSSIVISSLCLKPIRFLILGAMLNPRKTYSILKGFGAEKDHQTGRLVSDRCSSAIAAESPRKAGLASHRFAPMYSFAGENVPGSGFLCRRSEWRWFCWCFLVWLSGKSWDWHVLSCFCISWYCMASVCVGHGMVKTGRILGW